MSDWFVGLDISTTGTTALAISRAGKFVVGEQVRHTLHTPHSGWAEQSPDEWWQAVCTALKSLWKSIQPEQVKAVGLTGQMLGLVTLDKTGQSIRPAILWNDQRSAAECEVITERFGAKKLYREIGSMLLPGMTLPKLTWMQTHEPDNFQRIVQVLLPKDYVGYRLSGTYHTDVTDASGTGLFNIERRQWSTAMAESTSVPNEWLPKVFESQHVCGAVTDEAAKATGLLTGTPLVAGAGDQPAQAVGSGIVQPGDSSITVGTSGVVFIAADKFAPDPAGRWHTFCHAIPNQWCHMGVMLSAAGSLQWLKESMFPHLSFAEMDKLAAQAPAGCDGLMFAPYLSGERHPYPDPHVRAGLIGLSLSHSSSHIIRAVMEGVAYGFRDLIELAREAGSLPTHARVSGGAAKSELWMQILADAVGLPLTPMQVSHGGALGAAMLAAVGVGSWPSVAAAGDEIVRAGEAIAPSSDQDNFERFRKLYPALSKLT